MKVYLGGPMRGQPLYNFQAFENATWALREAGIEVVSPHELDMRHDRVSASYYKEPDGLRIFRHVALPDSENVTDQLLRMLADDIRQMRGCDALIFLDGWENSLGCQVEDAARELARIPRFLLTRTDDGWELIDPIEQEQRDAVHPE